MTFVMFFTHREGESAFPAEKCDNIDNLAFKV